MDSTKAADEQQQQAQTATNASQKKRNRNKSNSQAKVEPDTSPEEIPIEDAMKAVSLAPHQTPVSVLQELLSRQGITPSYELVQIEGAIHEPTFRYRVSYGDKDAMGAGKSKKEAKHAAAKNLIDKMTGAPFNESNTNNSSNGNLDSSNSSLGNPIGWLQELCMARRWPPPTYETELEVGLPHERQFTIACVVLKHREIGQGKSKKVAKRSAANKMWIKLQETPLDQGQINQVLDEDGNVETSCLNDKDVNFVQFLQEIANEHQFEVTYVDIEEKTYSGRCQCLVQLSTLPVAVCQGSGATTKDAQSHAARNALEYLKIMTKM
ncbi:interferon-inducible double-stranded RNA-dependent protein kinase activator A homolog isoform X4 [Bradysia coprophila]|uniref:interferon-inducible double-stranded RNA-dependent protein kinase activator A homolog isoform X4 n=1 Tax=Bradysia coprophila TaxID=38358 RepID=UPI00187D79CA|nr:interferon-inducible double-stranded RNA-dependent protein kinase activator A homolog isoform X4 [Bradysia coprophila]